MSFLPITIEEVRNRGWDQLDFVFISGDAYVDHPSFGHAIITRVLAAEGYKVGIIAQPDWKSAEAFKRLGKPRLGFLISSGNVDSMVNHYSVFKRKRKKDYYSPGGKTGLRPDRAAIVYANRAREAYKDVPIILGGIESSLRRLGHYDYWDGKIRRSILLDSKADILSYGMGEKAILEIAEALDSGIAIEDITWIKGTVFKRKNLLDIGEYRMLPSFETILQSKKSYGESFLIQYNNMNHYKGKTLVEDYGNNGYVVQTSPQDPLTEQEMDRVYGLPYTYTYHDSYEKQGGIPAIEEVKYSITSNRGCFGSCNFCALTFHQGDVVQVRSKESILAEGKSIVRRKGFKGFIHDVGGPTANFRQAACKKQAEKGSCSHRKCLFPEPCDNLIIDHQEYLNILRDLRRIEGVKKVFVRSGIRYDYAIHDKDHTFIRELCQHHVSGHLKIAPEHISDRVLERMGKPSREVYERFTQKFDSINKKIGKKQYIIPYFISSHPGSTIEDAIELAIYLKRSGFIPEQVQDFYPTPGTLSTCMYYTGMDPVTMEEVYIPKTIEEKNMQRALLQFNRRENFKMVRKALEKAGRTDLIGYGKDCLVPPEDRRKNEYHQRNSRNIKNK